MILPHTTTTIIIMIIKMLIMMIVMTILHKEIVLMIRPQAHTHRPIQTHTT